jgi:hypothetical protein
MSKSSSSNSKKPSLKSYSSDITLERVIRLLRPDKPVLPQRKCAQCLTGPEWAELWGIGINTARRIIRRLLSLHYLKRGIKRVHAINGMLLTVTCYEPTNLLRRSAGITRKQKAKD